MAVCNLFKKLEKPTGNFLMFSQYVEDITKMYTQPDQYRATPSKFIALNIDYSNFRHADFTNEDGSLINDEYLVPGTTDIDYNILIPTYLQNHFENCCAFMREAIEGDYQLKLEDGILLPPSWNQNYSKNALWNSLYEADLIHLENVEDTLLNMKYTYIPEIVYYDEINIQSYNEYAGMGYNEIYCYIPNEGKRKIIKVEENNSAVTEIPYEKIGIMGFEDRAEGMLNIFDTPASYYYENLISPAADTEQNGDEIVMDGDEDKFDFNTIIVMYDISVINESDGSYEPIFQNIPMGIYFTGIINNKDVVDPNSNMLKIAKGSVTNTATKYVSNPDIFGAGTSYGLRICNRFIVSPNSDYVRVEVPEISRDSYSTVTQLLSEMGTTLSKMNDVINNTNTNMQFVKESLAAFKNRQVNVPYVKNIMGKYFWFVNGKNTHVPVECMPYEESEITNNIDTWEETMKLD